MSNYDGQDQAYQDLLSENAMLNEQYDMLHEYLQNIAALIEYQAPLKAQDRWLATMIERGFYTPEEEE